MNHVTPHPSPTNISTATRPARVITLESRRAQKAATLALAKRSKAGPRPSVEVRHPRWPWRRSALAAPAA